MFRVRKGDTIEVISGDEKGNRGTVHQVLPKESRVIISGVNIIVKHQRPTGQVRTQTGRIEREAPMHLSNVAPVCKNCDQWTRVGFQVMPDGSKVRLCKRCGGVMD
ncbi:MAG: 50S ribosomal protein L24 [Chloroflexi bacterium RBG_16_57_9]|nr:MAG: 50S ribosomal protein L24 [Chloroflexi bacterium RBG_16_57_9]